MTDTATLTAGRELDALVAESILKTCAHRRVETISRDFPYGDPDEHRCLDCGAWNPILPAYSTDIAAAWLVLAKVATDAFLVNVYFAPKTGVWTCFLSGLPGDPLAEADTAPLAICHAALVVVTP